MSLQCYFKRHSSIHGKSDHVLMKGFSWQGNSTSLQEKTSFRVLNIFLYYFIFKFIAAILRLVFGKGHGQLSKSTKLVHTKLHLQTSKRCSWLGFMTHPVDVYTETVNSFGYISNPCTAAFPEFQKNKSHSLVNLRQLDDAEKNIPDKSQKNK